MSNNQPNFTITVKITPTKKPEHTITQAGPHQTQNILDFMKHVHEYWTEHTTTQGKTNDR